MANILQQYFPAIRTQEEIMEEITESERLWILWQNWNVDQQKEFLNFCTGIKGIKILYDSFFKEIMDPDTAPERLEELLSLILGQKIRILKVLPNDSTRIADESSLVIMDIVIELADHSIANVEVQKLGYKFPGQKAACYSADLLLRQYKRIKGEKGKTFSYRDIKKVYTIIFYGSVKNFVALVKNGSFLVRITDMTILIEKEFIYGSSKRPNPTDYYRKQHYQCG